MSRWLWAMLLWGVTLGVWAGPRLSVSELIYDFGEIKEGILVVHTFLLANIGDAPLVFPRPPFIPCGCTSAGLPKDVLNPGESMPFEVRFESTGFGGYSVVKHVYLYTNDPNAPQVVLTLQGRVRPREPHEESAYTLRYRYRLILDVRDRESFVRGHLLGAVNVPAGEISAAIPWLPASTIYVCDAAGEQGLGLAEFLRQRGFWATRALRGGLAGWLKELGPYLVVGEVEEREPQVSPAAVAPARLAQEYLVLLDFRPPEAYARAHLLGAIPVGPTGLDKVLDHLLPATKLAPDLQPYIFCVDEDETVAWQAARFLRTLGLWRAYALVGGLPQWHIRYGSDFMVSAP